MTGNRDWCSAQDNPALLDPFRMTGSRALCTSPNLLASFGWKAWWQPLPDALVINWLGHVEDARVTLALRPKIERGAMTTVHGIVVHQTGGSNAKGALSSYEKDKANGAHFLVDKDGTIYQTASVYKSCNHAGALRPRCMAEQRCTPADLKALKGKAIGKVMGRVEAAKSWPDRYPGNSDSIGIELVGRAMKATAEQRLQWKEDEVYEPLTPEQQTSLEWLLRKLTATLQVSMTEVFRHPTVSWKNSSEAGSAKGAR